jgi:hypothetical protein
MCPASPAFEGGVKEHNKKKSTFPGSPTLQGVELHFRVRLLTVASNRGHKTSIAHGLHNLTDLIVHGLKGLPKIIRSQVTQFQF